MLIHIVAWKYKESTDENSRREHCMRLKALAEQIPVLRELHVGSDVLGLDRSYDTGLLAKFDDQAGLDAYTNHPEHLKVAEFGKQVAENVISVDFFSQV